MKKNNLSNSYGKITEKILDTFAETLIATKWSNRFPNIFFVFGKFIKLVLENKKFDEKKVKRALYDMKRRKLIEIKEEDNQVKIYLKDKYKIKVITRSIKKLLDFKKKKKKWNGHWFMVFFDVPEKERQKREYLRRYLKKLGFYQYQKSVYIFPFECKKEIGLIKQIVEGAKYMKYIVAKEIEEENKIKKKFNLQ